MEADMTDTSFFIALGLFFVVDMVTLILSYVILSRRKFMSLDLTEDKNFFPHALLIQFFFMMIGLVGMMKLNGTVFDDKVLFLLGGGAVVALTTVPFSDGRFFRILMFCLRLAVFSALVFLSPEPAFMADAKWPPAVIKAGFALVGTLLFERINGMKGKTSTLFLGQMLFIGGVMTVATFMTPFSIVLCRTGSLLFVLALALIPFPFVLNIRIQPSPLFFGAISFFVTILAWAGVVSGFWPAMCTLLSFYLTDVVYGGIAFCKNLFRREEKIPLSLCERFQKFGATDIQLFSILIRQEILFGVLTLFCFRFEASQKVLLLLTILIYAKFLLTIFSPTAVKSSYGQVFRQIGKDVKANFADTIQTFSDFNNRNKK